MVPRRISVAVHAKCLRIVPKTVNIVRFNFNFNSFMACPDINYTVFTSLFINHMSFKQFQSAEFNHRYLKCSTWSCFRSYWQQIDDAVAKSKGELNVSVALEIARDLDLLGESTWPWQSKEKSALEKVFQQDQKYLNALPDQLQRLKSVLRKLQGKLTSARIDFTLKWLDTKYKEIVRYNTRRHRGLLTTLS